MSYLLRLGSLEDSIPESERPAFGFVHKIRSPEHKPLPLLEDSLSSSSDKSSRLTYDVGSSAQTSTRTVQENSEHVPSQPILVDVKRLSGESGSSGSGQGSADTSFVKSSESTKTVVSLDQSGTLKAEDLAGRLEAIADQLGSHFV